MEPVGAVLNWIALGTVVAVAATAGLRVLGPVRAHVRYRTYEAALWIIVSLPLVPILWATLATAGHGSSGIAPAAAALVTVPRTAWNQPAVLAVLGALWAGVHLVRLLMDLCALRRARLGCQPLPAAVRACLRASTTSRLAEAGARLAASPDVRAAAVLGCGPPIIALQPALLTLLTESELDQIVVHEWAHVVRRDARASVGLQVVRMIAGWHPAVWWTIRRLRLEREMACDEIVVDLSGSPRTYAACLTRLAALMTHAPQETSLAMAALSPSGLRRRVVHLLSPQHGRVPQTRWAPTVLAALLVGLAAVAGNVRVFGTTFSAMALVEAESLASWASTIPAPVAVPPLDIVETLAALDSARRPRVNQARITAGGSQVPADVGLPTAAPAVASGTSTVDVAPSSADQTELQSAPLPTQALPTHAFLLPPAAPSVKSAGAGVASARVAAEAVDIWNDATNTGIQIGRTSQQGATATASFFTRVGKNVARSF